MNFFVYKNPIFSILPFNFELHQVGELKNIACLFHFRFWFITPYCKFIWLTAGFMFINADLINLSSSFIVTASVMRNFREMTLNILVKIQKIEKINRNIIKYLRWTYFRKELIREITYWYIF